MSHKYKIVFTTLQGLLNEKHDINNNINKQIVRICRNLRYI